MTDQNAPRPNPAAAAGILIVCFSVFAYVVDDIIRATSIFFAPIAAFLTLLLALALIRMLPRR